MRWKIIRALIATCIKIMCAKFVAILNLQLQKILKCSIVQCELHGDTVEC